MDDRKSFEQDFLREFSAILHRAKETTISRGKAWNSFKTLPEQFVFGETSHAQHVWQKTVRAISAFEAEHGEALDDSLIDLINYAAFWLAYRNLQRKASGQ